jgi:hypothetical protein
MEQLKLTELPFACDILVAWTKLSDRSGHFGPLQCLQKDIVALRCKVGRWQMWLSRVFVNRCETDAGSVDIVDLQ